MVAAKTPIRDGSGGESPAGRDGVARPLRRRRLGAFLLTFFGATVLLLMLGFLWFVTLVPKSEAPLARSADGIVVLTGGASRIADAIDLLAARRGQRLLISGAHSATRERELLRLLPVHRDLVRCCVDLDHDALNTLGNALGTRRWVKERGFRSLIVVTSNYHMPRAIVELSHAMPDIQLIPFAVVGEKWRDEPWWTSGATLRLLLSEYVKYVAAELRVRLADVGLDLPDLADQPAAVPPARKPATAHAN